MKQRKSRFQLVNDSSLNRLEKREPEVYGALTLDAVAQMIHAS